MQRERTRSDHNPRRTKDRDRGPGCPGAPPTPPGMRVRTRRLSTSFKALAETRPQAIESRPSPQMIDRRTAVRPLEGKRHRETSVTRTCSCPFGPFRLHWSWRSGTTAAADFCAHGSELPPAVCAFRASPTHALRDTDSCE